MKHLFSKILLLLMTTTCLFGQERSSIVVRGNVYSKDEGALIGVSILEVDKNNRFVGGGITDMEGNFALKISNPENTLTFSYLGFESVDAAIGEKRVFNIELKPIVNEIEEVSIIGEKKVDNGTFSIPEKEISVAIQTIKAEEWDGISVSSIDDALQGKIAGLDIVSNSGNVGSGSSMRIRGVSSINGNTEPLIVVDGVIFETQSTEDFDFASANEEQFADLLCVNPDDIESISVMKDAAATAIWGSKGANGVLAIKTKKGVMGKTRFTYTYRFTGAWQPDGYNMLNGDDYTMLMKEAYFNPTQSNTISDIQEFNYDPTFSEYENYNNNTDWVDEVKKFGVTHDHYLTVTGGGKKALFLVSGGYYKQSGSLIGQQLERYSTRMNLDYFVSDRIKFTTNFSFTYTDNDKNYDDLLEVAYQLMPNMSVYEQDEDGNNTDNYYKMLSSASSQLSDQAELRNPVASANLAKNNQKSYRILPTFRIQYDLLDPNKSMLRYKAYVSFDVNNNSKYLFLPKELSSESWLDSETNLTQNSETRSLSIYTDNNITWQPHIKNKDHSLMLYASFQASSSSSRYQKIFSYGVPSGGITDPSAGGYVYDFSTSPSKGRNVGFLFTSHYVFKERYILDLVFRRDGSSRYGEDSRFGNFPGVSLRWNIIDENFMKGTRKWLSMLSLRPSWGITGNQPKYESLYYSLYESYSSYMGNSTVRPSNVQLSNLRWEKVWAYNVGMDFGFFNNKFTMDFNYYYKRTEDMLFEDVDLPGSSGCGVLEYQNGGIMDNEGWEFNFNANRIVKRGDFSMDVNFNLSNYVNTIIELDPQILSNYNTDFSYDNGDYLTRIQENNAFGSIYGFRSKGVYQYNDYVEGREGTSPVARDEDGAVIMDANGDPMPMYFGYGTSAEYQFKGGDAIYEDVNHDGNISELDIVYLGNSNPKINGGVGVKFRYKKLSLNVFSNFRYGNKVVNYARMNAENMYTNNNQVATVNWRWRKDGDVTDIPRALYNSGYNWLGSDRYVEDGSFFRIKYVTLRYEMPKEIVKDFNLTGLSFYITANNVATFTKYSGVDPEVSYGTLGVSQDKNQTPRSKSFTAGVSVVF